MSRHTSEAKLAERDFRLFLQDELTLRCRRNPNYSLRSFAKSLSISPSALSALLNKKRPLTEKMKLRLGLKLGLPLEVLAGFQARAHGNSKATKIEKVSVDFKQLTVDHFNVISEPHHYAILELSKTVDFSWRFSWIARRLGKTVSEIRIAIERLERTGLLVSDGNGSWTDSTFGFSSDIRKGLTSQAQRRFQKMSLEAAISSLETIPVGLRDNTSITMAVALDDLPKARQMIADFRRKLSAELEPNEAKTDVYQFTVALTPLTEIRKFGGSQ